MEAQAHLIRQLARATYVNGFSDLWEAIKELWIKQEPESTPVAAKIEAKTEAKHGAVNRPGPGRKPNPTKLLRRVSKESLADAVANTNIAEVVSGQLRSKREVIRRLIFLYDCMLGKPKQDVTVAGGIVHTHTRDPFLASLPKEGLEMLARSYDEVVAKYALRATQDGPENQIEAKPAIEAENP